MKEKVSLLITDLDDTIWSWLDIWFNSFLPYLDDISFITGVDLKILKESFKKLHQKYNSCEASFAFKELDCFTPEQIEKISSYTFEDGKTVIHRYNSNKKANTKLYDGALETLRYIKTQGTKVVGFTESNTFYTKYRIKHLELDGIFDAIYSPEDPGIPESVDRYYDESYWTPKNTKLILLPHKLKKPKPSILHRIINDFNIPIENTLYVGDKLDRDVYMANLAGVTSVYAQYGHKIENSDYELLRDVTHWPPEEVQREIEFKNKMKEEKIIPDYIITSYEQLKDKFIFSN